MAVEKNAAPTDHDSANAGGFSDVPDHAAGATSGAAARFRPATIKCPHHTRPSGGRSPTEVLKGGGKKGKKASSNRLPKIGTTTQGMPGFMWLMLIIITAVLVGFVVFSGAESPTHMVLAGLYAASAAMVLVLVRMLDFPFEGALAIPDTDFVKMFGEVAALARGAGP